MNIPRLPTVEELKQLADYQTDLVNEDHEITVQDILECAYIAVFEHYMTDSPGYAGKIMTVVWSGGPDLHETYCWNRDGKIYKE